MLQEPQKEMGKNVPKLVRDVPETDLYSGQQAIPSPAMVGEPASVPLVDSITTGSRGIRWRTIQMSGEAQKKTEKNVQELVRDLQEQDIYNGMQTIPHLAEIGEPAVGPLIDVLRNGPPENRWKVAMALARLGTHAVDPLIEVTASKDVSIRNPAIWALAEIGSPKSVESLIRIMQDEESECCRILTAAALLKINDPAGVEAVNREFERMGEEFHGRVDEAFYGS